MKVSDLEMYEVVGKMFREIRENKGYSLEYVAEHLGTTIKTLQRYEVGERSIKIGVIKSLCEFYNIDCYEFMKDAKMRFVSDIPNNEIKQPKKSIKFKDSQNDRRLQEIIDCYNSMSETGKELLLSQARLYKESFSDEKGELNRKEAE